MADKTKKLTTASGMRVDDDQNSLTAGPRGPVQMQDVHLMEKLAHFNRERIPERVVHAKGAGAYGVFECTADMSQYTRARFLSQAGKKPEMLALFSTVGGERGSADTARDPRGFALKFYTEEGNYDMTGNNTPVFFIRDPLKFPDFIHSQKPAPNTNRQEPDNVWDFFSLSPEATHMFTWLFGDRGIPASYRHMDGFGSHTFQWINEAGEQFFVKYHFKTDQGIECLTAEAAAKLAGENPDSHQMDLHEAIHRGEFPSWTLKVQIMPAAEAKSYRFNPFDVTKVWPHADYPLQEVGKLALDRNPANYFADVEQSAFNPANFVPGIGPSPDKMLQGRLFAYGDAQRYRLGSNHTELPVNSPHAASAANYGRDGFMRPGDNAGAAKNYEPNSFDGPAETGVPLYAPLAGDGSSGSYEWDSREGDDFAQAGALYRVIDEAARARLVANIAGSLAQVSKDEIIERSVAHLRAADPEYGERVAAAVVGLRGKSVAGR